jgi:CheY-like chemotaxis protein
VADGAQAVRAALSGVFDLVLMDVHMPATDGIEAAGRIRSSGQPAAGVPIVALTADGDQRDVAVYLAAGMDAVVAKPIRPDALLKAMLHAVNARKAAAERAA